MMRYLIAHPSFSSDVNFQVFFLKTFFNKIPRTISVGKLVRNDI